MVARELQRNARDAAAVARALTAGTAALEQGDAEAALAYLEWAKSAAPRAPSVREALAVARYLTEDWSGALAELKAYRRLTGRHDQNHLIADCLRALDRPVALVAEEVQVMDPARDGEDRYCEGMIVWGAALADAGDPGAGRAVVRQALDRLGDPHEPGEHHLRLWYVAGDLAERDGAPDAAVGWFARVATEDAQLYDVGERLARLGASG